MSIAAFTMPPIAAFASAAAEAASKEAAPIAGKIASTITPCVLSRIAAIQAAESAGAAEMLSASARFAGKVAPVTAELIMNTASSGAKFAGKVTPVTAEMLINAASAGAKKVAGSISETLVNIEKSNGYKVFKLPSDCLGHLLRYGSLYATICQAGLSYIGISTDKKVSAASAAAATVASEASAASATAATVASDALKLAKEMAKSLCDEIKKRDATDRKLSYIVGAITAGVVIATVIGANIYSHRKIHAKVDGHTEKLDKMILLTARRTPSQSSVTTISTDLNPATPDTSNASPRAYI